MAFEELYYEHRSLEARKEYYGNQIGSVETHALILENELNSDATGLTLGYKYSANPDFKIEIAVVTLTSNQLMEKIGNSRDTPYYATFVEAKIDIDNSINDSLSLGTLAANTRLGVWIRRTLLSQTFEATDFSVPYTPKVDSIQFVINFTQ